MMKYIIFDFNGTILDDVDVSIKALNYIVKKYLKRKEVNKEEYLEVFDFPVIDYYKKIGFTFDEESFMVIGQDWVNKYQELKNEYQLMTGIKEILISNIDKGYKNIILSASKLDNLLVQCCELNISEYFEEILGIDDIYASSKLAIAKKWIKDKNPNDCILIGDTLHDLEVAKSIGAKCLLVAKGHQSKRKLEAHHDKVYDDIKEVIL